MWRVILAVLALAGCVAPTPQPPDVDPYPVSFRDGYGWIEAPSMPFPAAGAACAFFDGDLWSFGGIDQTGFVGGQAARFSRDNGRGDWTSLVSMPNPVHGATAAPVGDRIHILGGYKANGRMTVTDQVLEYVPRSGFYNVAPIGGLPGPLAEATYLRFDGIPSVAGGTIDGQNANDRILSWDPIIASAGWHEIDQRLVNARAAGGFGITPEGFFAAAGGWADRGRPLQEAEMINWDNGGTIPVDGVPTPRHDAAVGGWENLILVAGGVEDGTPVATAEILDLSDKQWFRIIDLPQPLSRSCLIAMGDGLHLLGGVGEDGYAVDDHWILQKAE